MGAGDVAVIRAAGASQDPGVTQASNMSAPTGGESGREE